MANIDTTFYSVNQRDNDAYLQTNERIREKMGIAMGADQPSVFDIVKREDYKTEAEYIQALAATSKAMESPEYRRAAQRAAWEQERREQAEIRKAQREEYQEIRKGIDLTPAQKERIDRQAAEMGRSDLANGRISASDLGKTIEAHAQELRSREIDTQATSAQFNSFLRGMIRGQTPEETREDRAKTAFEEFARRQQA